MKTMSKEEMREKDAQISKLTAALEVARDALMKGTEHGGVFWRETALARIDAAMGKEPK